LYSITDTAGNRLLDLIENDEVINIEEQICFNIENSSIEKTTKESLVKSRVGQGIFRDNVKKVCENKCAITGSELTDIHIASHIKPWKYSSNEERLDPYNGFLLSPTYDKLFDKGYISFDNKGKIILSSKLDSKKTMI